MRKIIRYYKLLVIAFLLCCYGVPGPVVAQSDQAVCDIAEIQSIKLIPNSTDHYDFFITAQAQMPTMHYKAEFVGADINASDQACLGQQLQTNFDWSLKIEYWDGIGRSQHKILPNKLGAQRSGFTTNDGWTYAATGKSTEWIVSPSDLGERFGGGADGKIEVTLHLPTGDLATSLSVSIWGTSVDKTDIKLALGDLKYQLLGYLESKFTQIYNGIPLANCGDIVCSVSDGGFGIMQITDCSGAAGTLSRIATKPGSGHGYPSYRQLWDWQANILAGKSCYDNKVRASCAGMTDESDAQLKCGYARYNGSNSYGELGITILNEMRNGRFRAGWF